MKKTNIIALITFVLMFASAALFAQKNQIERVWYNQEKTSKIQVYLAKDGKYYGKIVWLDEPNEKDGKPKVDKENPESSLKDKPLNGLLILKGFSVDANDKNLYTGGTVYDPKTVKLIAGN